MSSSPKKSPRMAEPFLIRAARRVRGLIYVDLGGGPEDCVMLAGTGRSGTTWVGDIINYKNEYRTLFEPLWNLHVPLFADFSTKQYLPPEVVDQRFLKPMTLLLSGDLRNFWADRLNTQMLPRKRLIKEIRGNLLLGWIRARFPELPIILLLRHPCATAISRVNFGWEAEFDEILAQRALMSDHLEPYRKLIEETEKKGTLFDKHVLLWCIENYVPIKQLRSDQLHLAFYENFCVEDPREEIEGMFKYLGKPVTDKVMKTVQLPSATTRTDSAVVSRKNIIDSWRKRVDASQIESAISLLSHFGLDRIYGRESLPNRGEAARLIDELF